MATEKNTAMTDEQLDFHTEMMEVEKLENERKKTYSADGHKSKDKTKSRRMITGAVFCFLAVAGLVSILSGIFNTGVKILDNNAEKQEYNSLLTALVMYDPRSCTPTLPSI